MIAGLIRGPNAYSPFIAPERALRRRNTVLRLLLDAGDIDRRRTRPRSRRHRGGLRRRTRPLRRSSSTT